MVHSYERLFLQMSSDFIQYDLSRDLEAFSIRTNVTELMPLVNSEDEFSTIFCHPGEEFIYVLEGVLTLMVEGKRYTLFPNDSIHIRPNAEHAWCNKTNTITKILSVMI